MYQATQKLPDVEKIKMHTVTNKTPNVIIIKKGNITVEWDFFYTLETLTEKARRILKLYQRLFFQKASE